MNITRRTQIPIIVISIGCVEFPIPRITPEVTFIMPQVKYVSGMIASRVIPYEIDSGALGR